MQWLFLKKKKTYVIGVLVLLVLIVLFGNYRKKNSVPVYDTARVIRGDLFQSVEATGKVESVTDLSLRFELPGIVDQVKVTENNNVKIGEVLATLRLAELNAAVAQANANLNQKLAGPSTEDRNYYQAAVDSAKSAWEQGKIDVQTGIVSAEAALETARNNLRLAEGGDNSQIVRNAYDSAVAALQTALITLENGLTQADNILGVDNSLANDDFDDYLSILDSTKLVIARDRYALADGARDNIKSIILNLGFGSDYTTIDNALNLTVTALSQNIGLLSAVGEVLTATPPVGTLTQAVLDSYKTVIDTARSAAATQYTNLITQKQTVVSAQNSYSVYLVAYEKAEKDWRNTIANADNLIATKKALYDQALANYHSKINPPREIDIAAYRAVLASAVANRDKAIIRAPIDGLVTQVSKKKGEYISAAETMIHLLAPHYEIKVDIPETDIIKMKVGDKAQITLDAFGDEVQLSGTLAQIDPAATEIQDVVYYKITVTIDETDQPIKSGMTANVVFATAEKKDVLFIPARALRIGDDGKYVKVLVDTKSGTVTEKNVVVGLKADDGRVEIIKGLSENEEIILGTK